jgi:hypothetical protein
VTAVLEEVAKKQIKFTGGPGEKCGNCRQALDEKGPRWWVCGSCKKACTSWTHPAWAPPTAKKKEETETPPSGDRQTQGDQIV